MLQTGNFLTEETKSDHIPTVSRVTGAGRPHITLAMCVAGQMEVISSPVSVKLHIFRRSFFIEMVSTFLRGLKCISVGVAAEDVEEES